MQCLRISWRSGPNAYESNVRKPATDFCRSGQQRVMSFHWIKASGYANEDIVFADAPLRSGHASCFLRRPESFRIDTVRDRHETAGRITAFYVNRATNSRV